MIICWNKQVNHKLTNLNYQLAADEQKINGLKDGDGVEHLT